MKNSTLLLLILLMISCGKKGNPPQMKSAEDRKVSAPKIGDSAAVQAAVDASQTVVDFYGEYYKTDQSAADENILRKYVTRQLADIFSLYTSDGENLVLDYDPFINGQDYDYKTLMQSLSVRRKKDNEYLATFSQFPDVDHPPASIVYKMVSEGGKMKIAEIPSDAVLKDLDYISPKEAASLQMDIAAAIQFLKWYAANEKKLYSFQTIKGGPSTNPKASENYSVDFAEVKKEVDFLRKSNLFTRNFLKNYYNHYLEGDRNFKEHPADDGPPEGFEADYFFRSQDDFMADLKSAKNIKIRKIPYNHQKTYVEFSLPLSGLKFYYTLRNEDGWKIDAVGAE